jgi:hypothetical protein
LSFATQRLSNWKEDSGPQLEFHQLRRIHISKELCKRALDPLVIVDLRSQQQQLDGMIVEMVKQRKDLEVDLTLK